MRRIFTCSSLAAEGVASADRPKGRAAGRLLTGLRLGHDSVAGPRSSAIIWEDQARPKPFLTQLVAVERASVPYARDWQCGGIPDRSTHLDCSPSRARHRDGLEGNTNRQEV
jgi:hypothetical protein